MKVGDKSAQEDDLLFPNIDPDIRSLLTNKFKDSHVRKKLLEDTFNHVKVVLDQSGGADSDDETAKLNLYFYDIVQNRAKLLLQGVQICKITN